ncbi:MAG: hypothetical protein QOG70_1937 [Solirubrobacteraceae bacterium]|nr:hypothetical protein [Solirubrobacteraceae bacterium]
MILHFSHIGLTDGRTFMIPFGSVTSEAGSGRRDGCRYRSRTSAHAHQQRVAPTFYDSKGLGTACVRSVRYRSASPAPPGASSSPPSSCHGVRMRGPSAVIATVNSKWAASEPSWE